MVVIKLIKLQKSARNDRTFYLAIAILPFKGKPHFGKAFLFREGQQEITNSKCFHSVKMARKLWMYTHKL